MYGCSPNFSNLVSKRCFVCGPIEPVVSNATGVKVAMKASVTLPARYLESLVSSAPFPATWCRCVFLVATLDRVAAWVTVISKWMKRGSS